MFELEFLIIIGYGGHAQDLIDIYMNTAHVDKQLYDGPILAGFLDDNVEHGSVIGKIDDYNTIVDKLQDEYEGASVKYLIGINSSTVRKRIDKQMSEIGAVPGTLVHRTAHIGHNCEVGPGTVMGPFSALTSNVVLGRHVHLNTSASVNQGSRIGDYCTLSPGVKVCGDVIVGDCVSLGANSTIINLKNVGHYTTIGAGGVVIDDIPPNSVAVGVPARVIKDSYG